MMVLNEFWQKLDKGGRIGVVAGVLLIAAAMAVGSYTVLRADYQVLFTDMSMQDTSAMVAELDRLKIPYRLGEGGTSILVEKDSVYKTRLKLMGKDLPLHGAVGLELFNSTDFGMTEFAQKINYQRALQGELTRTILSLPEVQDARVHLAFPEQGLFKQQGTHPKAAIYLTLKQAGALHKDQVSGIQRLVAAAVPGVSMQDVTIVDQHGVALTRAADAGDGETGSNRFDVKRELENYLSHKVGEVLDRAFGPGQAIASVDVSLNMDQVRLTQENVVGAPAVSGKANTGFVVRERETVQDGVAPLDARAVGGRSDRSGNSQHEVDYQLGRRVEQIVSQPGSIQQIQVVALVRKPLDVGQIEQLKRIVSTATGISIARGDTVEVQTIDAFGAWSAPKAAPQPAAAVDAAPPTPGPEQRAARKLPSTSADQVIAGLLLLVIVLVGGGLALYYRSARRRPHLSPDERNAALEQMRRWLQAEPAEGPL